MLSRVIRKTTSQGKNFSIVSGLGSKLFNLPNSASPLYGLATANPLAEATEANPVQATETAISVTELDNGIRVVTETPDMPGTVGVQVLLNVGTRDETAKTSGSLLSIQNTYYKTVLNTNETINYGMVQMSGGNFTMDYDQETSLFSAHCLEHDVVDVLRMVSDCALEPRSVVAANVGIGKNKNSLAREASNNSGFDVNDTLFRTAYGLQGLGMPLLGLASNVEYLNANTLQSFQINTITPNRIVVGGSNVQNHEEFVELVQDKLSFIPAQEEAAADLREAAGYIGGETKINNQSNRMDVILTYETQGWTGSQAMALQLAAAIIGTHSSFDLEQAHFAPGHRAYRQLVSQHSYIDDACAINFNFSDSGLFGIRLGGVAAEGQSLFDQATAQLQSLATEVTQQELQAAQAALSLQVLRGLETPHQRMTETLKNVNTYGQAMHGSYLQMITSVTASEVQAAVAQLLSGTPTIIVNGGQASGVNTNL